MTQMGRRGGDNQIALDSHYSSIAMLQERFRQLERAKETREERELLMMKTLSSSSSFSSSSSSPSSYYQDHYGPTPPPASKRTVNAELSLFPGAAVAKPSSSKKISLSLWPGADSPVGGFRPGGPTHTSVHGNNWVIKHEHHGDSDYCDVDTSLHL
ncbi:hypothetical protein DM860_000587 [Cuscuta australis]|uniref:Uncharacterized protein n=1 Tax=Cuscuta australis TaxID=267555 RepID=A0A328D206_9ASTE|nr:hypothetical protein DM860_000587 [Cuscuta australis]